MYVNRYDKIKKNGIDNAILLRYLPLTPVKIIRSSKIASKVMLCVNRELFVFSINIFLKPITIITSVKTENVRNIGSAMNMLPPLSTPYTAFKDEFKISET